MVKAPQHSAATEEHGEEPVKPFPTEHLSQRERRLQAWAVGLRHSQRLRALLAPVLPVVDQIFDHGRIGERRVSPRLPYSSSAILRRIRRMILPERVFGRLGENWMRSGDAIGLISLRTQLTSSVRSCSVGCSPAIKVT